MAKRSLQASGVGVRKAKQHFSSKGWTQEYLANEVGIKTRQPIWRFFAGQAIERYTFFEICTRLDLDWREIAHEPPAESVDFTEDENIYEDRLDISLLGVDILVQKVRSQRQEKINNQCGILQLLDINRPVLIEHIYVDVNILEQIPSQQWLETTALDNLSPEDIDHFGIGQITESQTNSMLAVEKYSKLRILGQPGSGKSTLLKHLAIQCNRERFAVNQVPIFITLRDFAESSRDRHQADLLEFIHQEFINSDITQLSILKKLLQSGRILLLIDGMDEISHEDEHIVLNEIRRFCEKYHRNQIVVTCRTASQKLLLQGFTDVEIAPFTEEQIGAFAQKWFIEFSKTNDLMRLTNASDFLRKLNVPQNWRLRRLITTPLFLHLSCSLFQYQDKFPIKQSEFYKQCMDLLLGKWDESKGIERNQIYRGLLLPQKVKLLSQIASATFEQGQYFFKADVIEQHISDYLRGLPDGITDPEEIHQASESILREIESQHGILVERAKGVFSFSYLALQEYFTARKIVANHNLCSSNALQELVKHINDPHWREVFLLTMNMLRSGDGLVELMKQEIDGLVSEDPYLQEFLAWASKKAEGNPPQTRSAMERAIYLALTHLPNLAPHLALAFTINQDVFLDIAIDELLQECMHNDSQDFACIHACGNALDSILGMVVDLRFHKSLQQICDLLPQEAPTKSSFKKWCKDNYSKWVKQLHKAIATHRQIDNQWKFDPNQQLVLKSYYDANQLLLDCLNGDCEVTASIREEIEATLLLPQTEIERREWE